MNLRRTMLVVGMALAAVAAMAPTAQAEITHNTQSITQTDVLHYEGHLKFIAGVGVGLTCPVTAELHVSAAGVPSLQSFVPDTESCTGTGPFAGCVIEADEFHAGSVHVNTTTPDLTVTDFTIRNVYSACLIPQTHLIFPALTLKPHIIFEGSQHHSIDTLTISGTAGNIEGTPGGPIAFGMLEITSSQEGTYTLST